MCRKYSAAKQLVYKEFWNDTFLRSQIRVADFARLCLLNDYLCPGHCTRDIAGKTRLSRLAFGTRMSAGGIL